jgi:hypothetical protein
MSPRITPLNIPIGLISKYLSTKLPIIMGRESNNAISVPKLR